MDAEGDPSAVFIFQIGSTLTSASDARVEVINGGSNCNVFWQVGSSATLGTTSFLVGNILALTSITPTTGASVTGRLLARNGAVTLDGATITDCGAATNAVCPVLDLQPETLPAAAFDTAYSQTLLASGGTAPYLYTVSDGALPPGFTLSSSGELTGTPTTSGSFTFTVRATDSDGCVVSRVYTLDLSEPLVIDPTVPSPSAIPALSPLGLLLLAGLLTLVGRRAAHRRC